MFYRLVDSKMGEDGDKLRAIEMDIFYEVVKQEVEHLHGPWEGSMEENGRLHGYTIRCKPISNENSNTISIVHTLNQ